MLVRETGRLGDHDVDRAFGGGGALWAYLLARNGDGRQSRFEQGTGWCQGIAELDSRTGTGRDFAVNG